MLSSVVVRLTFHFLCNTIWLSVSFGYLEWRNSCDLLTTQIEQQMKYLKNAAWKKSLVFTFAFFLGYWGKKQQFCNTSICYWFIYLLLTHFSGRVLASPGVTALLTFLLHYIPVSCSRHILQIPGEGIEHTRREWTKCCISTACGIRLQQSCLWASCCRPIHHLYWCHQRDYHHAQMDGKQ